MNDADAAPGGVAQRRSPLDFVIRFCLENKLVVAIAIVLIVACGALFAPFDWHLGPIQRFPVATDAIPDTGENQQIVFTEWMGRSPQDIEDQITYPLTVSLLGVPGVKTVRSSSFFGFSSIYVIFDEDVEFYWSRTRILEKLNSLPSGTLPDGVKPALGPDATPLGQIYWYTLEGRDPDDKPIGGWDLHELRTVQDWDVRYHLLAAEGISEVASIGGFVQEYQIDVDPDAMRAARVSLDDVFTAVRKSNIDVGARTVEINRTEYFIRGLGFIRNVGDLEISVVAVNDNVPIYVKDVAKVTLGPAPRRGALDKGGAEAVGGAVVVRYGFNPLAAIKNVKEKIEEIAPGMPTHVVLDYKQTTRLDVESYAQQHNFDAFDGAELNHEAWVKHLRGLPRDRWPAWANTSQLTIVAFYDRSGLIYETLGTLNTALIEEILVTIIVILISVLHLRSSFLISMLLPLAVLMCFIAMKVFGVEANIVALSGIAIAIGTMVDMGIILCENILKHLEDAAPDENRLEVIFRASSEVGSAVLTAVATTVIGFLPVFTMIGAEGKLFRPLAFTKTFALISSVIIALTMIPPAAHLLFTVNIAKLMRRVLLGALIVVGLISGVWLAWWIGVILVALGAYHLGEEWLPGEIRRYTPWVASAAAVALVTILLTEHWLPLGPEKGITRNLAFVVTLLGGVLFFFKIFEHYLYVPILRWCLAHKLLFLSIPSVIVFLGVMVWVGPALFFDRIPQEYEAQDFSEEKLAELSGWQRYKYRLAGFDARKWPGDIEGQSLAAKFDWTIAKGWNGLGTEFMPPLDEGSYLYMPSMMPHASIGEALDVLRLQDKAIMAIPEVVSVVGKLGRVESPLDPAPVSMIETVVNYHPEYITDKNGHRTTFRYDEEKQQFERDETGNVIADAAGRPYRLWRDHIRKPDDIWAEIVKVAQIPGTTSAPKLQPIAARRVMLQSGMRAPMGVKVKGPDLETVERVCLEIEGLLKQVSSVEASAVIADRIVGKPYLVIDFNQHRERIARYGLTVRDVQDVVEVAIGGRLVTTTVEGRARFPVRVRYPRELRGEIESMERILVPAKDGSQIPLIQLADIDYVRGPQVIKTEDTYLTGYVLFDMKPGNAEVDVVEACQRFLAEKEASGQFIRPAGVTYQFAGNYENQQRAQRTLMIVLPAAFLAIVVILYFQFRSMLTTAIVFSGIGVAWAGGFLMIWCYAQPWFLNFTVFGTEMQTLFQIHPINLSIAVWVGFLALFGIASDDGVVIATYLDQSFFRHRITTAAEAREATVEAGRRRCRPCLMTTATTILALIPVLTSSGRGSDIMVPMAIPSVGGMTIVIMSMFMVPTLYCAVQEYKIRRGIKDPRFAAHEAK